MAARPRTFVGLGVLVLVFGYVAMVGTGQVRPPWSPSPDPELLSGMSAAQLLDLREGSRNANRTDDAIAEQAPLDDLVLFLEDPDWWIARCKGFFAALYRAEFAAVKMQSVRDEAPLFPFLKTLPNGMGQSGRGDAKVLDQLRRYERSFPFHPAEIPGSPLYQTDLPICLEVARGIIPKRP